MLGSVNVSVWINAKQASALFKGGIGSLMNLEQVKAYQRKFSSDRNWDQFHTPKNLVSALSVEASELVEIFQWLSPEESESIMSDQQKADAVKHEVSDILYYLLRLADKLNIDVEQAFWEKTKHNEKKYPVEKAWNNAKKYTEL